MNRSIVLGLDPVESLLASGEGNLAEVYALAVLRSEPRPDHDHGPDSTADTERAPAFERRSEIRAADVYVEDDVPTLRSSDLAAAEPAEASPSSTDEVPTLRPSAA